MLSTNERQSLERYIDEESILVHGSRQRGLRTLGAFASQTLALDANHSRIIQNPRVYATESIDVGSFCATTWSRDGWSGWFSYEAHPRAIHEFFAAPYVLKEACFAIGSLYTVRRKSFKANPSIPGEFVSEEDVPIEEEFTVDFGDIRQHVWQSAHMAPNRERALRVPREPTRLNTKRLLRLDPSYDPRKTLRMDQADNWYDHHAMLR